jgi:hypothetical protein
MAKIIVTSDQGEHVTGTRAVLLEEDVYPVHVATDHGASQLMERLAWAIGDAESAARPEPLR